MRIPYETPPALGREFIELEPEVVAVILLTLAAGWQRACAAEDVNANAGEVIMTERLRDGMRIALKNSPWKQIMVLPGTESRSKSNVMLPDARRSMIRTRSSNANESPGRTLTCVESTSSRAWIDSSRRSTARTMLSASWWGTFLPAFLRNPRMASTLT